MRLNGSGVVITVLFQFGLLFDPIPDEGFSSGRTRPIAYSADAVQSTDRCSDRVWVYASTLPGLVSQEPAVARRRRIEQPREWCRRSGPRSLRTYVTGQSVTSDHCPGPWVSLGITSRAQIRSARWKLTQSRAEIDPRPGRSGGLKQRS